jgi:hypothetical protein
MNEDCRSARVHIEAVLNDGPSRTPSELRQRRRTYFGRMMSLGAVLTVIFGGLVFELRRERALRIAIQRADVAEKDAKRAKILAATIEVKAIESRTSLLRLSKISIRELQERVRVVESLDPAAFSKDKEEYERLQKENLTLLARFLGLNSQLNPDKSNPRRSQAELERAAARLADVFATQRKYFSRGKSSFPVKSATKG